MKSLASFKPEDVPDSLVSIVKSWLKLDAMLKIEEERVTPVQTELLTTEFAFYNDRAVERGEEKVRITDNSDLYLSRDDDLSKSYYERLNEVLIERKIKTEALLHFCERAMEPGYCPILIIQHQKTKAEWVMLDIMSEFLEMGLEEGELNNRLLCGTKREGKLVDGLTFRQEFIDTTIKLVVSLPDFEVELP